MVTAWGRGVCALMLVAVPFAPQSSGADDVMKEAASVPAKPSAYLFMLTNPIIRKELGTSPEQDVRIAALHEEYVRAMQRLRSAPQSAGKQQERINGTALPAAAAKLLDGFEATALEILTAEQDARLEQLRLRARRFWIVFEPSVQEQLSLEESLLADARKAIQACNMRCQQWAAKVRAREIPVQESIERVEEEMRATHAEVLALLSPEQQTQLRKLLGAEPHFDPASLRYRLISKAVSRE